MLSNSTALGNGPDGSVSASWLAFNADGELVARMIQDATYFSQTCYPLDRDDWASTLDRVAGEMGRVCWAALSEPIYEGGLSDANIQRIAAHVKHLRQTSDRAIMIAFGANLFEWASYLRRMDNFLMDLVAAPARAEALLDKLVEIHLAGLDRLLPVLGDNVDLIQLGDDLGTENGPFFSPKLFRELFKPRYRIIINHVRRNIDTFGPGGGFVFCQVHNILAEVPPENVVAMYEAAME